MFLHGYELAIAHPRPDELLERSVLRDRHRLTFVGLNSGLASPMKQRLRKKDLAIFAATVRATQLFCVTTENVTIDNLV